ncbi:MAG: hypothetical protein M1416_01010 [Candidatus Pacearchaeota archaeon]|nr:hypothetical protein [Candidatus Pacearchaeota archaeon]
MIPLKFFNKQEKEKFIKKLNEQFGIKDIPFSIAKLGSERIIIFSGDVSEKEILGLDRVARIEGIGLYFAKIDEKTQDIRLSIEGVQLVAKQITKNIFELDEKTAEQWMMGQDLNMTTGKKGFYIMKFKDDFLGTGKISAEKISNFIPKSRRLKYKENQP